MILPPTHRFFFAVRPPLLVARQIVAAAPWFDAAGRMLRPEHLHVTLDILDDLEQPPARLDGTLRRIGDAVAAAPFDLAFDLAVGSRRSIALRPRLKVGGLEALRRTIAAARHARSLRARDGYAFAAHMTLGYRDGAAFSRPIAPIGWHVDEFVLIHSHVGKTRHETIGRWPLVAPPNDRDSLF